MVDLATIGTAVNIAGKVGGLLGIGGDDGPSIGEQYAMSRQHMAKAPSAIRRGAERAGFNPLTVLSSGAVGGSPGISLPSAGLNRIASLEGIGTALNEHVERKQAATLNAANIELASVQAERAKAGGAGDVFTRTRNSVLNYRPASSGGVGPTADPLSPKKVDPRPVTVQRDDGLTSANPDAPVQPEEDLWAWWRNGTMMENLGEMSQRNIPLARSAKKGFNRLKSGVSSIIPTDMGEIRR